MSELTKDTAATKTFFDHMWDFNKYGFTLVEMILGYDLGLFEVLKDASKPLTSTEIAEIADLKERYVREWLAAISAARVISIHDGDGHGSLYSLSEEHYGIIKTSVAYGKLLRPTLGRFEVVKSCFQKQGPMGDANAFDGEFAEVFGLYRTEMLKTSIPQVVFQNTKSVKGLYGKLEDGCSVVDIGCGNGDLTMAFAKRYPKSFFTGIEISEVALTKAWASMTKENIVSNICFKRAVPKDLSKDTNNTFDVVMVFQVLHNLPDPMKMIEEIDRMLKPGGNLIVWEIEMHTNHPTKTEEMSDALQISISQFYCLPFSMSAEPHIGYGASWGKEAKLEALGKHFTLDAICHVDDFDDLYCLTKNAK